VCEVEGRDSLFKGVAEAVEGHTGGDIDAGHVMIDRVGPVCGAGHVIVPPVVSSPLRLRFVERLSALHRAKLEKVRRVRGRVCRRLPGRFQRN
jgi:hypothetical protein